MKVSSWVADPEAYYCSMRIVVGGDPNNIADRVAFIEKSGRVRIAPFTSREKDYLNWQNSGIRSSDYGNSISNRKWCDEMLVSLGYELE